MKLYHKKLYSVRDLNSEKELLQKQAEEFENEDFISLMGLSSKNNTVENKNDTGNIGLLSSILPLILPTSVPILEFFQKKGSFGNFNIANTITEKSKKALLITAKEVIGGYLKWKAIELTFKAIRHIIKHHNEVKKEEEIN